MGIPGEGTDGVYGGAEFLRQVELGDAPPVGKAVAVIGGGNVAIDVARTCRRMGAEVTIVYRREQRDMPAAREEVEDALAEGISLKTLMIPQSISKVNGRLKLVAQSCEPGEFDKDGRRRPVPLSKTVVEERYDTIFAAVGQSSDASFAKGLELQRGWISVDRRTLATNLKGIYAGGDAVTGPAMAVDALAAGKRAAFSIDRELSGRRGEKPFVEGYDGIVLTMKVPEEIVEQEMARAPKIAPKERIWDFREVEEGFDFETVKRECERCLRCDVKIE
jgi:NADH-quinone oxidoreductase subunit F